MANTKLVVLDISGRVVERWLGHDPNPDNRIARYLSWATTMLSNRNATHCFATVDHPLVERYWRRSFDQHYQSRLEKMSPGNINNTFRVVRELPELGIPVLMHEGMESVDMIASLVNHFSDTPQLTIEVLTDNFCCHGVLAPSVSIVSPYTEKTVTATDYAATHGFQPRHNADFMALVGKRFGLPSTPHLTEAVATELIVRYGTVERILLEAAKSSNQASPLVNSLLSNGPRLVTVAGTCQQEVIRLGKLKLSSGFLHQVT